MFSRSQSLATSHAWMISALANFSGMARFLIEPFQRPLQETGLACVALHFAAGGAGNAPGPEQHRRVDAHVMLLGDGPPDGANHGVHVQRQSPVRTRAR